ncbi:hypothetical protein MMC16_002089 [Acarospora aff. strigata]|nr:hypothetical protein [Acarospora aff. strigata]
MASMNFSFYIVTGAEIHWRQIKSFPIDAAGTRTMLYGSTGCFLISAFILSIALALTPHSYALSGHVLNSLISSLKCLYYVMRGQRPYTEKSQTGRNRGSNKDHGEIMSLIRDHDHTDKGTANTMVALMKRLSIIIPASLLILLQAARPHESAYLYLSWTLPLSPLSDIGHHGGIDVTGLMGDNSFLSNCTSLTPPPKFDWLPVDKIAGFEDWYGNYNGTRSLHYNPAEDPLQVSNLENDLLEPVRTAIHDNGVNVKHIILIKLESTRKDVFPLIKDDFLWHRIAESHQQHHIPLEIEQALGELTKTAEYLTGDYTGFKRQNQTKKVRGGITASNAFTTSTYTLKSLTGTLCGIMPLVADFNQEYKYHIYQPCIAHILEAFNRQSASKNKNNAFISWPWRSVWMQSVTNGYDNQAFLIPTLGYKEAVTRETLVDPKATHFPPKSKDINYYGLPDTELKPYLHDAIETAEKNQERLFITHLTGTTHHPWGLPKDVPYKQYIADTGFGLGRKLNRYLNTIGFVDKWLGEILSVLEETGVANETLLVLAGDHGDTLPETGGSGVFDNPHVGGFHIPLLLSHPALPSVRIKSPVTSLQVLPTILDLLISTSSLTEAASKAASDLLPLYEGQSLLRPLVITTDEGHPLWQFSVMNAGGSWLAMRSTTEPFRLIVPLVAEVEWRFTDLDNDPHESEAILTFDWFDFRRIVRRRHGRQAAEWLDEAARVAKWWVSENRRLWRWEESGA